MGVGIEVTNLNAWYGANHTLQDINLPIPANHATALIGPSGCGKSTFVRCLNRMHETNPIARVTGSVKIGDLDIYAISPYDDQHRLAWAGALVLIALIVLAVSLVRYVASRGILKGAS